MRDDGLLRSAIERPINKWHYEQADLPGTQPRRMRLGLRRTHAFVDGNKRIAFMSMMLFLRKNGVRFAPDPAQATKIILSLAAGEVSEESLARWIRANWPKN